jgi:serine/threonine-protein kinase
VIGDIIGSYRIVAELGKGGMGMVYRAEHTQLGRPAALKMLLPQLSSDAGIVQRFFNEARAASAIDHPGIVQVYDFGTAPDGRAYIVMELLKGESLEQRLQRGPLSPVDGATILAQTAAALSAAHARGIVHRDLKPDNIFLVPNELVQSGTQVKLLDFGIAKLADEQTAGVKTQTGAMMGTPAYMSPEQCMGKSDLDHRTDIYSVGCILFHVLCGRPPFTSDHGTGMLIAAHIRDAAPDPRSINPNIPPALVAIIERCLQKEPAARYQSAAELRNALVAAGANAPLSKPPVDMGYMATLAPMPSQSSGIGTAPTTHSASAAQVVPVTQPPPATKSKAPLVVVGGLVAALAAGGAVLALNNRNDTKPEPTAQTQPSPPPAPPTAPPQPQVATPLPPTQPQLAACDAGKTRSVDTGDHCCWPDQLWSNSKSKCVGKPHCPPGMQAKAEDCTAVVAMNTTTTAHGTPVKTPPPAPVVQSAQVPAFTLGAKQFTVGDPIEIKFGKPVSSKTGDQAWITVSEAGSPPSSYGDWEYVTDGATAAVLKAPKKAGAYEVRVHTNFPSKSYNVRYSVPITVVEAPADPADAMQPATPLAKQKFTLAKQTYKGGEPIVAKFGLKMKALPNERFWITVVEVGKPDDAYGSYEYVQNDARKVTITAPNAPGDYEVRLHANYPTKSTNLVHRARIRIE